jgi:hypothetical protein
LHSTQILNKDPRVLAATEDRRQHLENLMGTYARTVGANTAVIQSTSPDEVIGSGISADDVAQVLSHLKGDIQPYHLFWTQGRVQIGTEVFEWSIENTPWLKVLSDLLHSESVRLRALRIVRLNPGG